MGNNVPEDVSKVAEGLVSRDFITTKFENLFLIGRNGMRLYNNQ